MLSRFEGSDGRRRLINALHNSSLILSDNEIAEAIADSLELHQIESGTTVIEQDQDDNDLYFIISGELAIEVNNRRLYSRKAGQHVGEMALIDPRYPRSASVIAVCSCVVGKISESDFTKIANCYPVLWRRLAIVIADRLRNRNNFVQIRHERPILFIGSSKEASTVANSIKSILSEDLFKIRIWTEGVFKPSEFPIESLQEQLIEADFALLVVNPDDKVLSRDQEFLAPRDNIILELGLFIGSLGRKRTMFLRPRDVDLKIPSDLFGLTPLYFNYRNENKSSDDLVPACREIQKIISRYGGK